MKILGVDPSLNNFGYCAAEYDWGTGAISPSSISLIESPPLKEAKNIRKNCQDLQRARIHADGLRGQLHGIDLVMVEVPVGSKSARAMASYGMCVGILSWIDIPMIEVSPLQVKMAGHGTKTATKEEMITWATSIAPDMPWFRHAGKFAGKNEHIADALAAIYAGIKTEEFKGILAAAKFMRRSA